MKYTISQTEIIRRKKAYITLSISLITGFFITSLMINFNISIGSYLYITIMLFLLGAFSFSYFSSLSKMQIIISDTSLDRIKDGITIKYLFKKIDRIKIKYTSNKTIRDIYIWMKDGKSICITALDDFKKFKDELLSKSSKNVLLNEIHEPINFDHVIFYPILGLLISSISVFFLKFAFNLDGQYSTIVLIIICLYLLTLGIYFLVTKPISKSSAEKISISDNIIALLMIIAAIVILFFL